MTYDIHQGDVLKWAKGYDGLPFHALLTDCPYEMEFMGKGWDNSGVSFDPETWRLLAQHLYPGAFLFVMAGTINDDLISVAMRQAGLRKYHKAAAWSYGSGFPKATRLDTSIDCRAGAEREKMGVRKHQPKFDAKGYGYRKKDNGFNSKERKTFDVTVPATDLAVAWEGHRYGGQVLKPALEMILIFQKPYEGRPVDSITRTGAGALWIDGARIGMGGQRQWTHPRGMGFSGGTNNGPCEATESEQGRWPANLILAHDPACNGTCVEWCAARRLGEQSGELQSGSIHGFYRKDSNGIYSDYPPSEQHVEGDSGTAARYYFNADWMYERLETADPVRYVAKASTAEREMGLAGWEQTTVDDGRQTPIDNPYLRGETERRNIHPTVKPIDLCRWLATLLLPPALYAPRRLLCPFAGSGSEMIGAGIAGWEHVQGIELEAEYVALAKARLAWWIDVFPS